MGNMLARLLSWGVVTQVDYCHVDAMEENVEFAANWLPKWATTAGLQVEHLGPRRLHLFDAGRDVRIELFASDVFDFIRTQPEPGDLLVAHAFLDLLPLPASLPPLLSLTRNLAWLTVNFDGLTTFEPGIDAALDEKIERLYHHTMDTRPTGGDSRSGRHLYGALKAAAAEILAAGSSDWLVYPTGGRYPGDEAYFLHFILHFFEESLRNQPTLSEADLDRWLATRRAQVDHGELFYQAHQLDYLVRV